MAPFLFLPSAIKREVDVPVFHAQRVTDLATAARAVAEATRLAGQAKDAEVELVKLRKRWFAKRKGVGVLLREAITKEEPVFLRARDAVLGASH